MSTAFNRMPEEIQFIIIIGVIISGMIAALPHIYERQAYKNTSPVEYDEYYDQAGYPAGEGFTDIKSVQQMEGLDNFTITTDVSNLVPTHIYQSILGNKIYPGILRYLYNASENGIGQYYVLSLDSGEKIIVFIDDFSFKLPKKGIVTLPVANRQSLNTDGKTFQKIQQKEQVDENIKWYIDTTGKWRKSVEGKAIKNKRMFAGVVTFMIVVVITSILTIKEKAK